MRWKRSVRNLLRPRLANVWGAVTLVCVLLLLAQPLIVRHWTRTWRRPAPSPCRRDVAVNVLPPMPADDSELVLELFRYLTRPHPRLCHKMLRTGGGVVRGIRTRAALDGHKYLCMDGEQLDLPHTDHCLVYSIGISTDWSFDDGMEDFGCQVFAFDPSINTSRLLRGNRIHFQPIGVSGQDETNSEGWRLLTLDSMAAQLGHTGRTIHYLKMDAEGAEWEVLAQQASLGHRSTLAHVEQLSVELHFLPHLPPEEHVLFYRGLYASLLALQQMGFYLFSFEENQMLLDWVRIPGLGRNLTTAIEVVWMRSRCARQATGG